MFWSRFLWVKFTSIGVRAFTILHNVEQWIGSWSFWFVNLNNLWQRETTQTSLIGIFSTLGKLHYIKYLSIRINQVNLKGNFYLVPISKMSVWWEKTPMIFCLLLCSKMAFYVGFYRVIFDFEIQKKHLKRLKIQIIFWICVSNSN